MSEDQNYTLTIDGLKYPVIFDAPDGKTCPECYAITNTSFPSGNCWECTVNLSFQKDPEGKFLWWAKNILHHRAKRLHTTIGLTEDNKAWYLDESGEPMPYGRCYE